MGCGKTTLGRALAAAAGLKFIDLDHLITERQGASVPEIFARCGEEGFRAIERDMLHEASQQQDCIISCGGGTPCFFDNMEHMNASGTTLWLEAGEDTLFSRLIRKREKRPLLAGRTDGEIRDIIRTQLAARSPWYGRAALRWRGDSLEDRRQIDGTVAALLEAHPELLQR